MSITTYAAETKLSVSDATAKTTQMVYLTVSLSDCKKANTIGITMKYDSNVLKRIPGECVWLQNGTISDFDVAKNEGIWGTKKAQNINGDICTLAFRVNSDAPVGDTKVTCEVLVKNDSKVIGTYTAEGTVSVSCEHLYGEWTNKDGDTHLKECKYCQTQKTASHVWDEGKVTKEPTEKEEGIKTYQCKDCEATKEETVKAGESGAQENPGNTDKPGNTGGTNLDDFFGNSGESDNTDKPGNTGNSGNDERPNNNEKPGTPDYSNQNDKDTIEPNEDGPSDVGDTNINNDKNEITVDDHVHTNNDDQTKGNSGVEKTLLVILLVIVMGILFFVYKKINRKKRG